VTSGTSRKGLPQPTLSTDTALHRDFHLRGTHEGGTAFLGERAVAQRQQLARQLGPVRAKLFQHRPEEEALGGERVAAAVQAGLDTEFRDPQPLLGQEAALHRCRSIIAHLESDLLAQLSGMVGKEVAELFAIRVKARVEAGGKHHRPLHLAQREAAQRGLGMVVLGRQRLSGVVVIGAVALGHDVDVDRARHDGRAKRLLEQRALCAGFHAAHAFEQAAYRRGSRQELEVAVDFTAIAQHACSERLGLPLDRPVQQVQVRGSALGAMIDVRGRDGIVALAFTAAVELAHPLQQMVVHDRDHRADAEAGHLERRVDGVTQPHDGHVERV
jgi:hypothetical protein